MDQQFKESCRQDADRNANLVGLKISREIQAATQVPGFGLSLGFFLARVLDGDALEALEDLEQAIGVDQANQWMVDLLVKTGRYQTDHDGTVQAIPNP